MVQMHLCVYILVYHACSPLSLEHAEIPKLTTNKKPKKSHPANRIYNIKPEKSRKEGRWYDQ